MDSTANHSVFTAKHNQTLLFWPKNKLLNLRITARSEPKSRTRASPAAGRAGSFGAQTRAPLRQQQLCLMNPAVSGTRSTVPTPVSQGSVSRCLGRTLLLPCSAVGSCWRTCELGHAVGVGVLPWPWKEIPIFQGAQTEVCNLGGFSVWFWGGESGISLLLEETWVCFR